MKTASKIRYILLGAIMGCAIMSGVLFSVYKLLQPSNIEVFKSFEVNNKTYISLSPAYSFAIDGRQYYLFDNWAIRMK